MVQNRWTLRCGLPGVGLGSGGAALTKLFERGHGVSLLAPPKALEIKKMAPPGGRSFGFFAASLLASILLLLEIGSSLVLLASWALLPLTVEFRFQAQSGFPGFVPTGFLHRLPGWKKSIWKRPGFRRPSVSNSSLTRSSSREVRIRVPFFL